MSDVTDWISAGANVAAAVGTVGALWVGAVTLRRQVNDQHRAQASAITVTSHSHPTEKKKLVVSVKNFSPLPIYSVMLVVTGRGDKQLDHKWQQAIAPGENLYMSVLEAEARSARVKFQDSSGNFWQRHINGELQVVKKKGLG